MPADFIGNPRFTKELEDYLKKDFLANSYLIGDGFCEDEMKKLVSALVSYFAFYDDVEIHAFVKNNSRYKPSKTNPEELQKAAFRRLKGYLFEKIVCEIFALGYREEGCLFETGCVVIIDGVEVTEHYHGIKRRTIDFAGLKSTYDGNMLECKVHPNGITPIAVKYGVRLQSRLRQENISKVAVGFITAGSKNMARLKLAQQFKDLQISDPGLCVYDTNDLSMIADCA